MSAQWRLWSDWADPCPGWSESSLDAHVILWVLLFGGSFFCLTVFLDKLWIINFSGCDILWSNYRYGSDSARVMVGRKNFLSRVREAPTGVGLGLCVPGQDEDPSSLRWPIHWDLFPFPPEVRCTLSLTLKCCVWPETYDNIKIHAFVHAFVTFLWTYQRDYIVYGTEQNWFIIPIDYKAHGNSMINASCMIIHVYILMLSCVSKTIKGQRQILSNCVFYVWFLFQVKRRSYFASHDDIEKPGSRVKRVTDWLTNPETRSFISGFHPNSVERVQQTFPGTGIH